ncbi:trypsin-like peptidase domain-containing protein [Rhodocytophaga rosea]|uniref:trypsin-like peptidase domain-containing protein n=1 Tax=Rhodocytophaga rosea TaxID=2704465 RepID=UPI001E3E7183|nr:trypsin-like peptidase domain-containing protein [Rhodocytophaga rosea]
MNFIYAAERVRPAVVHIKTSYDATAMGGDDDIEGIFREFHGDGSSKSPFGSPSPRESAGSGVIISADGYIATNNHVVESANKIQVILDDKRSYIGTVVGTDPTTDLALVKIEDDALPFVKYGDSDKLKVGEWVLAVGNPFDLTSTVTAGIVSAKSRNINILRDEKNMQVESFIQTDAAVNPGNSGGALVDLKGQLVGINTAIATSTRFSQGYSFAVPVTLVKKVMDDLLKYGEVQRALLGVIIRQDIDADFAKEKGLKSLKGVYIEDVNDESAAKQAGIKAGDVVKRINDIEVNSSSELQGVVATYRPGDKVKVAYERGGKEYITQVTLRNSMGNTSIVKRETTAKEKGILGAELLAISEAEKRVAGIESGVRITKLSSGKMKEAGFKPGFIITHIDKKAVKTPNDVIKSIQNVKEGAVLIEGVYADGTKDYRAIVP